MKENIIHAAHWKRQIVINVCLPLPTITITSRIKNNALTIGLYMPNDRQPRKGRPLKRHRTARRSKIANDIESHCINPWLQIRSDVQGVVVPDPRTAPRRPDGDSYAIDKELVSGVGGKVDQGFCWRRREEEFAGEADDAAGGVVRGRVGPGWGPDPVGL
jgi:hypothetical protein